MKDNGRKITDITGEIRDGMWNYEYPFPQYKIKPLPEVPWVTTKVYCEIFEGLHSQTGTYLETPAHFYGPEVSYNLTEVPVDKLTDIPCTVIMIEGIEPSQDKNKRMPIDAKMLENALNGRSIPEGGAIAIGCGWGKYWFDDIYLSASPYFTLDAMEWIVSKKPFLLASDIPRWENLESPGGIFPVFYKADILMLAPVVSLEEVEYEGRDVTLTALPLKASNTSCTPCRAIIKSEKN